MKCSIIWFRNDFFSFFKILISQFLFWRIYVSLFIRNGVLEINFDEEITLKSGNVLFHFKNEYMHSFRWCCRVDWKIEPINVRLFNKCRVKLRISYKSNLYFRVVLKGVQSEVILNYLSGFFCWPFKTDGYDIQDC